MVLHSSTGLRTQTRGFNEEARNQKPKNQNLGENLLVSAGFLVFLVLHCIFWFFDRKTKKSHVCFGFHGVTSLKNQQNQCFFLVFERKTKKKHVFFWFSLFPDPKILLKPQQILVFHSKTKKTHGFVGFSATRHHENQKKHGIFWFFDAKTKKDSVKPKKPKIQPKPKRFSPRFWFFGFWFRVVLLSRNIAGSKPKPKTNGCM